MSKIKMPVRTPSIDMTPMVDLFFLLLTFFMLTTSFRPQEVVQVDTPVSISEKLSPEKNVITLLVSKDGKVFFNMDNGTDTSMHIRSKLLQEVGKAKGIDFTKDELAKFEKLASFGLPLEQIKTWINESDTKLRDAMQVGIPMDSTNNQLALWIHYARKSNISAEASIKGDFDADYKTIKKVFDILIDQNLNKFNLTTNLEKVEVVAKEIK